MKSKKSIFDAFVNLRSKKELRKITVKELCEKALINKSTFYTYYEDMFDLSDKIESEVVDGIVSTISNPQMMIDEPVKFYRNLLGAMTENKALTDTVFSGSLVLRFQKRHYLIKIVFEYRHFAFAVIHNIKVEIAGAHKRKIIVKFVNFIVSFLDIIKIYTCQNNTQGKANDACPHAYNKADY